MLDQLVAAVERLFVIVSQEEAALLEEVEPEVELMELKASCVGTLKHLSKAQCSQSGVPEWCPFCQLKICRFHNF